MIIHAHKQAGAKTSHVRLFTSPLSNFLPHISNLQQGNPHMQVKETFADKVELMIILKEECCNRDSR
jgi:hypothetical protein